MLTLIMGEGTLTPGGTQGHRDARKRARHNAGQISKYLEMRDIETQKGTAGSSFNLEADRKGESRAPMSERGFRALDNEDNAHFRRYVLHIMRRFENRPIMEPAERVLRDPTALRRWRGSDLPHHKRMLEEWHRMCQFLANRLEIEHPGTVVRYHVNPRDEEVQNKHASAMKERRWGTEHSNRIIAGRVQRVLDEEEGVDTLKAAIGLVADREGCSFPRVEKAWYFAQSEKNGRTKDTA